MKETHLAMASVPCQSWGPVYEDARALRQGTLFEELYLPFHGAPEQTAPGAPVAAGAGQVAGAQVTGSQAGAADKKTASIGEAQMLQQIQEVSFVLDDLTLYLDMHSEDRQALTMFQEKLARRDQLKREFAQKFYPLTRDCVAYCQGQSGVHGVHEFCWQDGPVPWEGV